MLYGHSCKWSLLQESIFKEINCEWLLPCDVDDILILNKNTQRDRETE